jgi:hypothetical protein
MKLTYLSKTLIVCSAIYSSTALSQTVIGSGTANNVPKFTAVSTVGNSQITDNGTTVSLGTASVVMGGSTVNTADFVTIQKNQNANSQVALRNTTTGTAASSMFYAWTVGSYIGMSAQNVSYTNSGIFEKLAGTIHASGTGGINLGTTANAQLSLWTNNTKRMTVTNTGSVGIGTATPDKLFTVISTGVNTQIAKFADNTRYIGLGRDEVAAFDLAGAVADVFLGSNGTNTFLRGNVGVGTNVPSEHFQIGDRFVFHDGGSKYIGYNTHFNGTNNVRLVNDYASSISFGSGDINFQTDINSTAGSVINGTSRLMIKNTGEIGIGTSTPNKKLTVVGDVAITSSAVNAFDIIDPSTSVVNFRVKNTGVVYAREVNVLLTTFPDYVFNKEYKLTPLHEVESYIIKNHHLKGFETAKEYESNGMNVGEVVKLQQEKIEELTLYIIEQQKQLEELKKDMKSLKK